MFCGLRILVIDENEAWRQMMVETLTAHSADVAAAGSSAAALAAFKTLRPHVIVSDLLLPRIQGYAFVQYLRQVVEAPLGLAVTPALAVTAVNEPSLAELARSFGFQELLAKPFTGDDLAAAVARLAVSHLPP